MHKDLSEDLRATIENEAWETVHELRILGQSLAIAREAWINAFDRAAEELDAA